MSDSPTTPSGRARRPSGRLLLTAAFLLLAGACTSSRHGAAGRPPSTSTSLPAATTTTEPPPQYQPSPYAWDRSTSAALAVGGGRTTTLSAVLAPQLSGPWLVFGTRVDPTGTPTATEWSSADGASWRAVALSGGGPGQALAASQYKLTTVVAGSTGEGAAEQAAVWLSAGPGQPYLPQSVPVSDGPSSMDLVTAGSLGLFATGTVDGRFAMWTSTNGRHWSELPTAEKVITSSPGSRVNTLLAAGDFAFAAGSIQAGSATEAALWATSDGLNWHLVASAADSFSGPGSRAIYSLAPLGTGLVAVGAIDEVGGWVPASWISPDGQSWSLPSVDFPPVPSQATGSQAAPSQGDGSLGPSGGSAARSVSSIPTLAGPSTVVAAGGGPCGQGAWQSTDGLHWTSLALPAADADSPAWRAEVVAATVNATVVLDAEPGQPYLLAEKSPSGGAGTWTQPSADPNVFGPVQPTAVPVRIQRSSGRLDLTVDLVVRPQSIGPATIRAETLSSSDGTAWTVVPTTPATTGVPSTLPVPGALTAALPTRWVAVAGQAGSAIHTWISANGTAWTVGGGLPVPALGSAPTSSVTTSPPTALVDGLCTARVVSAGQLPGAAHYVVAAVGSTAAISGQVGTGSTAGPTAGGSTTSGLLVTTRAAAAWVSSSGILWKSTPASAGPAPGMTQSMSGCEPAGSGLVAYGTATSANGAPEPALWRSTDGSSWSRQAVGAFGPGTPDPLVSLSVDGSYWLAAANPDPLADPLQPGQVFAAGPAAAAGADAGVGPTPSIADGRVGLWLSTNGGSVWQQIDAFTAPWIGTQRTQLDLVGFATSPASGSGAGSAVHATSPTSTTAAATTGPGSSGVPVVVGVVDGQLAVWTASAPSAAAQP